MGSCVLLTFSSVSNISFASAHLSEVRERQWHIVTSLTLGLIQTFTNVSMTVIFLHLGTPSHLSHTQLSAFQSGLWQFLAFSLLFMTLTVLINKYLPGVLSSTPEVDFTVSSCWECVLLFREGRKSLQGRCYLCPGQQKSAFVGCDIGQQIFF